MAEHRKSEALLPKFGQSLHFDARCKLNSTSRCDLDSLRRHRRVVSSYPIATSIATLTNVLVAPVSRANRRMALPLGPSSSTPTTIRPCPGLNEKLTTRSQYPEASCPYRPSQNVWDESRRLGGRPPRDP